VHAANRPDAWAKLGSIPFDLLVIGGGINGCGIARDAAWRGLSVALVEADDWGAGTSSRSSRLVHGGVRYLEHGWLRLVFEASRERRTLLRIAPHLVRPLAFTWPVYRGARVPLWKLSAGLWLYDALALFRNVGRFRPLSAAGVCAAEPAVRGDGLVGGARYWDAQTHDTRLTLANALDAVAGGAVAVSHAAVTSLVHDDNRVTGAVVHDALHDRETTVRARAVVNAAGPWSDTVRRLDDPAVGEGVRGTKGVHLMVPRERLPIRDALTLIAPQDGRVWFALPWGSCTMLGTTDTFDTTPPAEVRASATDVAYLLTAANAAFPLATLTETDVLSAWAGLRPLVASASAGQPSDASREHELVRAPSGLLSITGGKLTTYRAMASDVVDHVVQSLRTPTRPSVTATRRLPGGDIGSVAGEEAAATAAIGDAHTARHWVAAYGSAWRVLAERAADDASLRQRLVPERPHVWADVVHAVEAEGACTIADVLVRRLELAFEVRDHGRSLATQVAERMAPLLGWTPEMRVRQESAYHDDVARLFAITP
jgi:glycerol-3-phosphate dehydrogenase